MEFNSKSLVVLLALATAACSLDARTPKRPETPTSLLKVGEQGAVITRDNFDVSHIRANGEKNLMAAWGYVHGKDRLWQMDFMHRLALGMSAESYGEKTLKTDFFVRLMGLAAKAKSVAKSIVGTEEHQLLEHYAAGVNRAREEMLTDLPHQFQEFKVTPLPWSAEASILLTFLQGLDMTTRTFVTDAHAAYARDKLGEERFEQLFSISKDLSRFETTIIHADDVSAKPATQEQRGPDLEASDDPSTSGGSNVWAITGRRTESGHTIVANDTHLAMRNPATWHEIHLQLEDQSVDVYGYAVPGVPIIPAGFNSHVAWGVTLGYTNSMDLIAYPISKDGQSYIGAKGELVAIHEIAPDVRVRLGPIVPHIFWRGFKVSSEGILYPLDIEGNEKNVYVLKWSALAVDSIGLSGVLAIFRAKSVDEMSQALSQFVMPSFNFIFGDRAGGIGFRQVGLTPQRTEGKQGLTQGGNAKENWQGFIPLEKMPAIINPERGYLVSSNNMPMPAKLWNGSYFGEGYRRGFRARRIEDMIESRDKHSLAEIQTMQLDVLVPEAKILLPAMLKMFDSQGDAKLESVKKLLEDWDLKATLDAAAMTVFAVWKRALKDLIFAEELELLEDIPLSKNTFRPPVDSLHRALQGKLPLSVEIEQALRDSLSRTVEQLEDHLGPLEPDFKNWAWGNYHQLTFRSTSGDSRWDLGPYPLGGSERTVAKASEEGEGPFGVRSAASMRFVVELSDPPRGLGSLPGGQRDVEHNETPAPIEAWVAGKLRPMYFTDEAIKNNQVSQQLLVW
ncbi:MAG: penicillin acylase family protein [Deltaproteobacteria bacterium]|jgi:penicillin G amidase|nr:penicillin acylase family protein [Deltaproteobacteria bacterium]MBT6436070.1 penicillin acylase family protein [Deltaproteobacteria bacterium]